MNLRAGAVAVAVALLLLAVPAGSQPRGPVGLDVLPSLLELSVRPGERVVRVVTLTNPGEEPVSVIARPSDWTMTEEGEIRFEEPGRQPLSCASWIAAEPSEVRVGARGEAKVTITVQSPHEFSGTRWAVLFFSIGETAGSVAGRAVTLVPRVGLTVYLTADGTEREQIDLSSSSAVLEADGKARLTAVFENGGNTAVRLKVTWQIRSLDGSIAWTYSAPVVSLPGRRRTAVAKMDRGLAPGRYRVTAMARWGSRKWKASDCELVVAPRPSAAI